MKFRLSRGDLNSPAWTRIEGHLKERLAEYRRQNDDPTGALDDKATAALRGRIAMLKEILALGEPKPE